MGRSKTFPSKNTVSYDSWLLAFLQTGWALQVQHVGTMQAQSHGSSSDNGRLPTEQWQGQKTSFMRSNEHSKDRRGSWHPEGLEGAALHLVQGDEKNGRYA